jgi:DNA-binding transcriptional MerR regulator
LLILSLRFSYSITSANLLDTILKPSRTASARRLIVTTVTDQHEQVKPASLSATLAAKPFFKIGEVAKLVGVKPHVLRYWESEFPTLKPKKNPSGQRIYARADIEAIVEIQNLLYNERYTISGARKMLTRQQLRGSLDVDGMQTAGLPQTLAHLKAHVYELLDLLDRESTT